MIEEFLEQNLQCLKTNLTNINIKTMKPIIALFLLTVFFSCTKNEELIIDGISKDEVTLLHDESSKKWRVTEFYSNYKGKILDTDKTDCMKDDVYTFFHDKNEAKVEFGNNSCYSNYNDIDGESAVATYSYSLKDRKLGLDFGRGAYNETNKVQTAWVFSTTCIFMSSDKMIFTQNKNGEGKGIVFEKI